MFQNVYVAFVAFVDLTQVQVVIIDAFFKTLAGEVVVIRSSLEHGSPFAVYYFELSFKKEGFYIPFVVLAVAVRADGCGNEYVLHSQCFLHSYRAVAAIGAR